MHEPSLKEARVQMWRVFWVKKIKQPRKEAQGRNVLGLQGGVARRKRGLNRAGERTKKNWGQTAEGRAEN